MSLTTRHQEYKSLFDEWAQTTRWHGVLDFHHSKTRVLKSIWGIMILLGSILAIGQICLLLLNFSADNKWVISVTYETPEGGIIDWPNFTMCNLNWLPKSKLFNVSDAVEHALDSEDGNFHQTMQDYRVVGSLHYNSSDGGGSKNDQRVIQQLTDTCEDTILACGYSHEFNLAKAFQNCCVSSVQSGEPRCFKINLMTIFQKRNVQIGGYHRGIYFVLDGRPSHQHEQIAFLERPSAGFKVTLYYGAYDTDAKNSMVFFGTGTHSIVSLTAEKTKVTSSDHWLGGIQFYGRSLSCRNGTNFEYLDSEIYTSALCHSDCVAHYLIDECSCAPMSEKLKNGLECNTTDDLDCIKTHTKLNDSSPHNGLRSSKGFNLNKCISECLEPCEYQSIRAKISSAQFPNPNKAEALTEYMSKALNRNLSKENIEHFTLFEMYFEHNRYKIIEKAERTTVDKLISSIGGASSLFTGVSIITIVHAFLYLTVGAKACVQRHRANVRVRDHG